MSRYEYTFETNGTSALKACERPYLRLVTDDMATRALSEMSSDTRSDTVSNTWSVATAAVAAAVVIFLFALAMTLSDNAIADRRTSVVAQTAFEQVTVNPGDSVWSLAQTHGIKGCDTAEVVRVIEEKNGLATADLRPGQQLAVPAQAS